MNSIVQPLWSYRIPWLEHARLWMITDISAARGRALSAIAADGICGGVDVVVVRLKGLDSEHVKREAQAIADVCRETKTPWVLSHNIELVGELKPNGVHLGKGDVSVNDARLIVGDDVAIGYSAHTVNEITFTAGLDADYCWYSPIFDTRKDDCVMRGVGLDAVALVGLAASAIGKAGVPFPVVFLGGITAANVGCIIERGGTRVAAIGALCGSENVEESARELKSKLDRL